STVLHARHCDRLQYRCHDRISTFLESTKRLSRVKRSVHYWSWRCKFVSVGSFSCDQRLQRKQRPGGSTRHACVWDRHSSAASRAWSSCRRGWNPLCICNRDSFARQHLPDQPDCREN